jgi:outer membrane protein assembly factor BamB
MKKVILSLLSGLAGMTFLTASEMSWRQWRGPAGDGQVPSTAAAYQALPTRWSEKENVQWKTALPYVGHSTPVVGPQHLWLTGASDDGKAFYVYAIKADTGQIAHQRQLFTCATPEPLGNSVNNYAAPSVVVDTDGKSVYVHFGSYGTACLDEATAEVRWQRQDLPCRHYRGPGSSPVQANSILVLTFDGADQQYLVGLDTTTGATRWRTERSTKWDDIEADGTVKAEGDFRKSHTTPLVLDPASDQPWMINPGAKCAFAYEIKTGRELWSLPLPSFSISSMPLYHEGVAYLSGGAGSRELIAVSATVQSQGDLTAAVKWRVTKRMPHIPSAVIVGGYYYAVEDGGVMSCIDLATGESRWSERLGGRTTASLIYDGRYIFSANEEGLTSIIDPSPETIKIIHRAQLDGGHWASPAVIEKSLLLRTKTHLYRLTAQP